VTWARWTSAVLLVSLVCMYVVAKVHFLTRFFALPLDAYCAEHWPFTAGLAIVAVLLWVVAPLTEKRTERRRKW
jgi:hypothetical protein